MNPFKLLCSTVFFLTLTTVAQSQQIDTDNPSLKVDFDQIQKDSVAMPLAEYNEVMRISGFEPITASDPLVTEDQRVWLYYEVPLPEESEDAFAVSVPAMVPNTLALDVIPTTSNEMPVMMGTTINGISFDSDAAASGFFHIPPDPSGAVGTSHVCHVVNTSITCHTKAGVEAAGFPQSLANFFSTLAPENASFDPKIIWDQYENRFVAITLVKTATTTGDAADLSRLLIGVSETADPTGNWSFQDIDIDQTISGNGCWFDYPGFAVDDKAVYITGSYFRFSNNASCGASFVLIVDKGVSGGLYDGVFAADSDPATNGDYSLLRPSTEAGTGFNSTLQPAHIFGAPPANMGTWLVSYSGLSNGTNEAFEFFTITDPVGTPAITRQLLFVGNIDDTAAAVANAPQSGTATTLETNDRRTLNAVWRDDKLWVTTQVMPPSGTNNGQTTASWLQFEADGTNNISLNLSGEIGGEDIAVGATTFFPSIGVNASGDAGITFNASAGTIFPGAYATSIDGTTGSVGASETVQAGADDYVRTFGGTNRWGDYSKISLDPSDGGFWAVNSAAISNGTLLSAEDGRWQVFIRELDILLPVELSSFDVYAKGKDAMLEWTTASESNNYGFYIEQNKNGEFYPIDFVQGVGNSATRQSYEYLAKDLSVGTHLFRLRQVDFDQKESLSEAKVVEIKREAANIVSLPNPNPFVNQTSFDVRISRQQRVVVQVLDLNGKVIQTLHQQKLAAKQAHSFVFDGSLLPNSVYVLQVIGEDFSSVHKLILNK